jgi:hypothetical protein
MESSDGWRRAFRRLLETTANSTGRRSKKKKIIIIYHFDQTHHFDGGAGATHNAMRLRRKDPSKWRNIKRR